MIQSCVKCKNIGIVRVQSPDMDTSLARCSCLIGAKFNLDMPSISELRGWKEQPLPDEQFKPAQNVKERLEWWKEKLRIAQEFWKNNPPQTQIKKPYLD